MTASASHVGEHMIELLSSLSRDHNTTILVVTHDRSLANKTDRRFRPAGQISASTPGPGLARVRG